MDGAIGTRNIRLFYNCLTALSVNKPNIFVDNTHRNLLPRERLKPLAIGQLTCIINSGDDVVVYNVFKLVFCIYL